MQTAVTFDFHNTLVRCDAWFDLEVRDLPETVGRLIDLEPNTAVTAHYRDLRSEIIGHGLEMDAASGVVEVWRRVGIDLDPDVISPVIDALMLNLVPSSVLLDGVSAAVRSVHESGVPIGVVSSAVHHHFLEWSLEYHGIRDLFVDVVTSAQVGFYKSRTEIYEIAYARLGAETGRSIHVGDSYRFDHVTGRKAGLNTVWLNELGAPVPTEGPRPNAQVRSMTEVGSVILDLLADIAGEGPIPNAD